MPFLPELADTGVGGNPRWGWGSMGLSASHRDELYCLEEGISQQPLKDLSLSHRSGMWPMWAM